MYRAKSDVTKMVSMASFLLLLLSAQSAWADAATWVKQYRAQEGLVLSSMETLLDGFIVIGHLCFASNSWNCDGRQMVVRFDADGQVSWSKYYSGYTRANVYTRASVGSLVQPVSDGYVLLGKTTSNSVRVMKLDLQGEVNWAKVYSGTTPIIGNNILAVDDGYLVAGYRGGGSVNQNEDKKDAWVIKLDLEGNRLWEKTFGTTEGSEEARLIRSVQDGYIVAGGVTSGTGWSTNTSIWLMKLNPTDGSIQWQKTYDSPYPLVSAMHASPQGLVLAGQSGHKAFAMELSSSGAIQWQYYYDGPGTDTNFIALSPLEEGYVVAAHDGPYSADQVWVLRLNRDGGIAWARTHAMENSYVYSIGHHEDGYLLGGRNNSPSDDGWDTFLFKLDDEGLVSDCSTPGNNLQLQVTTGLFGEDVQGIIDYQEALRPGVNVESLTVSATSFTVQKFGGDCPPEQLGSDRSDCESILNRSVCELIRFGEFHLSIGEQYINCPPACNLSIDVISPEVPRDAVDVYVQLREVLVKSREKEMSPQFIDRLASTLEKSTSRSRGTLDKTLKALRGEKKMPQELFKRLTESANEMALDLASPELTPARVQPGKYSAVDFNGVAWLAFRGVRESGRVSLRMMPGLPSKSEKYKAGWPITHYELDFTGSLAEDGFIDVHLYIAGVNHAGAPHDLRMLQWEGKAYRDITTNIDENRGIISGRTNRLTKLVVLAEVAD